MSLQYLKRKLEMKLSFWMQINIKVSYKLISNTFGIKISYKVILSLLMGTIKHSQRTQSKKFAISLQYFNK